MAANFHRVSWFNSLHLQPCVALHSEFQLTVRRPNVNNIQGNILTEFQLKGNHYDSIVGWQLVSHPKIDCFPVQIHAS